MDKKIADTQLEKSINVTGDTRSTADFIYFHPERIAVVELKKVKGSNLNDIKDFSQIDYTIAHHIPAVQRDIKISYLPIENRKNIKKILIIARKEKGRKRKYPVWSTQDSVVYIYNVCAIPEKEFLQ